MNMAQARRVKALIEQKDNLEEWITTFETDEDLKKFSHIIMESVGSGLPDNSESSSWDGEIIVERPLAIGMLRWAIRQIDEELKALGVEQEEKPA